MTVLYIAEVVGKAGLFTVKTLLPGLKARYRPDLVVVHADAASGGWGLTAQNAWGLRKGGADLLVLADLAYNKKDMQELLENSNFLVRPLNLPAAGPGRGFRLHAVGGIKVGLASLLGQTGFSRLHADNPALSFQWVRERAAKEALIFLVDFHAHSSAEKNTFFHFARGKCGAIIGSGSRVPTADGTIVEGTFTLTDIGRTGSFLSVGGFQPGPEIQRFSLGLHDPSDESWEGLEIQGVVLEFDPGGKALHFEQVRLPCQEKPRDS